MGFIIMSNEGALCLVWDNGRLNKGVLSGYLMGIDNDGVHYVAVCIRNYCILQILQKHTRTPDVLFLQNMYTDMKHEHRNVILT